MLDARRLRLLVELERRGTVAAVADALSYTPSAVSQQLSTLEREAGAQLFERVGRGIVLTDAGRLLATRGEEVLEALERAESDLVGAAGDVSGVVRVASFQTVGMVLLPRVVRTLHQRHPALALEFLDAEAEETLPALTAGELDLVVAEEYERAPRARDPRHHRETLCMDPLLVALPEGHPAARRRAVRLPELADEPWASARVGTAYAEMVANACRAIGGFEPRVRHRANDVVVMLRLVAVGGAVTIIPGLSQPENHPGIVARPVAERPLEREIFSVVRAASADRPAIRAVRRAFAEAVAELGLPTRAG